MEKAQIIYGETEYLERPNRTMQVVVIICSISVKTLYILNLGGGYEQIFTHFNDLRKYLNKEETFYYIEKSENTPNWIENYAEEFNAIDNKILGEK